MSEKGHFGEERKDLKLLLVTVSTTRSFDDDSTGSLASELVSGMGLEADRKIIKDNEDEIRNAVIENAGNYDCFVFMGGTGLSRYDVTVQALRKIADREVPGFGELFRARSENIFAYLSGAAMFTRGRKIIFCLPGSPNAQETGFSVIRDLIFHAVHEVNRT